MAVEAVLSSVLKEFASKLTSAAGNELSLLLGVEKEKHKLRSKMSRITAVLQDAESRQVQDESESAKDWLRKLKDAVYDAEDILDELVVEDRRRKFENEDGIGKKARNFFSPLNPLCFRHKIAHKIQELRERLDALAKENRDFSLMGGVVSNQSLISDDDRETFSIPPETCGRHKEKEELVNLLTNSGNEKNLSVIAIVGMGGLGKTTLAQLVYNHDRVKTDFQLRKWIYVSDRGFHVKEVLGKISECAINDTAVQLEQLQNRVREKLSGVRYLLVLDDVWNEDHDEWDKLRTALECGAAGSKILVTTRSDTVASKMDALPRPLGKLSEDESWTLFEKVAHPPPRFASIGKEIVEKCGGVPLAIKTLGGMLLNDPSDTMWQLVRDSELWKGTDEKKKVLSILRLSYDHLTSSLKQCFAYCAVIPKGDRFEKDELIKQWIAQGFIHSDDENELLEEEEGEKYFNALLRRSLFQVDVRFFRRYKMHDLIHDLLRFVVGKECFVVEASMMNDETRHLALCNDETRHLALLCNDEWAGEPKNLDALKKCKKLRSMITSRYGFIDINVCLSFMCLRVLDLQGLRIHFLPNSIDKLGHLRYFDISATGITELPETICNLHNLQTLRVLGIRLKKWPKNMKRMISLRHIEFDGWGNVPLPKGIGELTFLRTLPKSEFIIAKKSGAQIEELKDLNLLWGNIHIGGLDNIGSVGCAGEADLKAKKHLNSLKLSWSRWSGGDETVAAEANAKEVIEILEPHSDLKQLSVANYTGLGFPSWMTEKLTNLNEISLRFCNRCEWLPPLGKLDFLESLEIDTMDAVKHIVEFDGSHNYKDLFPSLKDLRLRNMRNLEGWSSPQEDGDGDEQVIFKCLRTLSIHECPKLTGPRRLPLLPSLASLDICEMSWDTIEIPTSQSLMEVCLSRMPNLERWSPHEADDGTPVIFHSVRTLSISDCPKLICLPMFLLPALEELKMRGVGCESIECSRSHSLKIVDLFDMPNLERWSLQEVDDDKDEQVTFHSLRTLRIYECPKPICPRQFLLPALEELQIGGVGWDKLEFSTSKSLARVEITKMPNLKRWSPQGDDEEQVVFNSLVGLVVKQCPRMVDLPHFLPSLEYLEISESNEMLLGLVANYTSLSELSIKSLPEVKGLPEELGPKHTSLRKLTIVCCPKLISLSNQLKNLLALNELIVEGCNDLVLSLPNGLQQQQRQSPPLNSLELLSIKNSCEKQISFPGDGIVLTSLRYLTIESCGNLESISADMLQNLTSLDIGGCPKLGSSLVSLENLKSLKKLYIYRCLESVMMKLLESMENLTSLISLRIGDCPDMRSLPKSVKNFTSLTHLSISGCPDMRSLPEWVGDLMLLGDLQIEYCPGMMSLPGGLQRLKNLRWLSIGGCPVLKRRLQRNKGEDWHKVAHVPYIEIDIFTASEDTEGEESSDQCPHLLLHSLKKLEKLLPLLSCCSSSPSSSSPPSTDDHESSSSSPS